MSRLEPYSGAHLTRRIESAGGIKVHHEGAHTVYRMPDGREVRATPAPKVDANLAHQIQKQLGFATFAEYRDWVGHPVRSAGKFRQGQSRQPRRQATRGDVLSSLDELDQLIAAMLEHARHLREQYGNKHRDPAAYQRAMVEIAAAKAKLRFKRDGAAA